MKFFNIEGPIDIQRHYYVSQRLDEQHIQRLIDDARYIVLHAPRQSGKTTFISALVERLNKEVRYKALYVNIDEAKIANGNVDLAMRIILKALRLSASRYFDKSNPLFAIIEKELATVSVISLKDVLSAWSESSEKPIVLFIDEIDALTGDSLMSILAQLRTGHANRPRYFPQSICLIGLRDVGDYRTWSPESQALAKQGSPFNIAKSLILPDFSPEEVKDLYRQHTQETGQKFTDEAVAHAFYLTNGQPWLVNALAHEACLLEKNNPITKDTIEQAKEVLISQRSTHIDSLIGRLQEPRVRAIIDAIISSSKGSVDNFKANDLHYVRDLGLIARQKIHIANPIYQEIIPRELTHVLQEHVEQLLSVQPHEYKNKDGSFNMHKLLKAFTQFYRENSAIWSEKIDYKESDRYLILMAFLQRVVNGGGKIHREYALGRGRVDLLVETPSCNQRVIIELKIKRTENTLEEGLEQTAGYMDITHATEGHLVIFDRNLETPWDEKIFTTERTIGNKKITVWGL